MKRSLVHPSAALTTLAAGIWMASACSIEDRSVNTDCYEDTAEECGNAGSSGGKGSGGAGGSGGGSPGSGGSNPGSGGTGGKASGGSNPGSGGTGGKGGSGGTGGTSPGTGGKAIGGAPGTGGAGGSGGTTSPTLEAAILRVAEASCSIADGCATFFVAISFGDEQGCVDRTVLANQWLASLPRTTWNKAYFDRCADAWEAAIVDADCDAFYSPTPPAACRSPGTGANGAPCNAYNQCSSYYCQTEGYDCGTCAAQPATGATCTANGDCREDQFCESDGVCRKPLTEGATCGPTTAECLAPMSCYSGTCTSTPYDVGDTCDAANGLYCDSTYGVTCSGTECVAIPSATLGDACTTGTFCLDNGVCTGGTCQAGPQHGDPCNPDPTTGAGDCKWPEICIGGFCELPQDAILCGAMGTGPAPMPG